MKLDEVAKLVDDFRKLTKETYNEIREEIKTLRESMHELNRQVAESLARGHKEMAALKEDVQHVHHDIKLLKSGQETLHKRITATHDALTQTIELKTASPIQQHRNEMLTMKDEIVGEIKAMREEQISHQGQHQELNDLPERVERLEKIHPAGSHTSA